VSCDLDYVREGDGAPLLEFDRDAIATALGECAERGVVRLRYAGKINAAFASMMQRVIHVADELDIDKRVLDINSSGGMVEDAIRTGDRIAESRWTVWVREDAVCHSACVFILAAGDMRMVSGRIGIHRIIRMSSTASTRVELNRELRVVYDRVRDYLERNGAATAVADLMMAVPNRNLRLLTGDELALYGLDGINPAQDDLDRLRLMRQCGEDFVVRRDAFVRAFDANCKSANADLEALNACGLDLRKDYGFPDATCPAESPLSEFDALLVADKPEHMGRRSLTPEQGGEQGGQARHEGASGRERAAGDAGAH
jgi:ATP-dependent protease ClpP protease subunit